MRPAFDETVLAEGRSQPKSLLSRSGYPTGGQEVGGSSISIISWKRPGGGHRGASDRRHSRL